jgi:uncharacterized protein (TIGR04255 family)
VNQLVLPSVKVADLGIFVRPIINFNRFPAESVSQFAVELYSQFDNHRVTLRSALLPGDSPAYVLDIDCYASTETAVSAYADLLNQFHDSAQKLFLDHLTEEYKQIMRGKK